MIYFYGNKGGKVNICRVLFKSTTTFCTGSVIFLEIKAKKGKTEPNVSKQGQRGQTGPNETERAKQGQLVQNSAQLGQLGPNRAKLNQMVPTRANWSQPEPNRPCDCFHMSLHMINEKTKRNKDKDETDLWNKVKV